LLLEKDSSEEKVPLSSYGGVAQLVERLTGSQEVRGFESHRLHSKPQVRSCGRLRFPRRASSAGTDWSHCVQKSAVGTTAILPPEA
jgi:hypothetical protein